MSQHRFDIGSIVILQAERGLSRPQGRYFVEAQLPPLGTSLQYRVKNENEGFRRVVTEEQMSSSVHARVIEGAEVGPSGEES